MRYKKIYAITSYYYQSGGTESTHQLINWLNNNGYDAYIYYYDNEDSSSSVPLKFAQYNVKIGRNIEDSKDNLLIVPETLTGYLYKYHHIQKSIWWLSLNYYLYGVPSEHARLTVEKYGLPAVMKYPLYMLFRKNKEKIFDFDDSEKDEILHFYNCEYVREYLEHNKVNPQMMFYLCGPIRDEYFKEGCKCNIHDKKNNILYNPNKGYFFTKKIINRCKHKNYDFVPLKNMTPSQVIDTMKSAKLYIDFGDFPGPERIPREAVTMKCNIIVARVGSSVNSIDVPIPQKYKFERTNRNIEEICREIDRQINEYEKNIHDFDVYRKKVLEQKKCLEDTLRTVFD